MSFGSLWGPFDDASGLISPQDALNAQRQGVLGLGAGLLGAAGPSPYPISLGQGLSSALLQGRALQNNAIDSALKRQLIASEIMARMAPADRKVVNVMTAQGPRLMYEQDAMRQGYGLYDPSQQVSPYQTKELENAAAERQRQATNDAAAREEARQRIALEQARLDFERGKPPPQQEGDKELNPDQRDKFRSVVDGSKLPPDIKTENQALNSGYQVVSPQELDRKDALAQASKALDQLEELGFNRSPSPSAPKGPPIVPGVLSANPPSAVGKSIDASSNALGSFFGTDYSIKRSQYAGLREQVANLLMRAEQARPGGGGGYGVERYLQGIPDLDTPTAQAQAMFADMRERNGFAPRGSGPVQSSGTPTSASNGIKFLGFEEPQTIPNPLTSTNLFLRRGQ